MNIYYAVLAAVLAAAAVAVAVYLILTLLQLRDTAHELELLARKVNGEVDKVSGVTTAVSGLAGAVGGTGGRVAAGVANLVIHLIQRYRRRRPVDVPVQGGKP